MQNKDIRIYLNTFISHIGYYSLMPIILFVLWQEHTKYFVLLIYLSFVLGYRGLKLLLKNVYNVLNPEVALRLISIMAGLLLVIIQFINNPYWNAVLFFALGSLFSLRGLCSQKILTYYSNNSNILSKNVQKLKKYFNYGALLGPVLSILIVWLSFEHYIFLTTGIFYVVAGIIIKGQFKNLITSQITIKIKRERNTTPFSSFQSLDWWLLALIFLGWFLYSQLFTGFSLTFSYLHGLLLVNIMYIINSILVLVFNQKVSNLKFLNSIKNNIFLMLSLFFLSILLLVYSISIISYFGSIIIFSFAELLFGLYLYRSKEKFSLKDNTYTQTIGFTTLLGEFFGSLFAILTFDTGILWPLIAWILVIFVFTLYIIIIRLRKSKIIINS